MSVEAAIKAGADNIAAVVVAKRDSLTGRKLLWEIVDDASSSTPTTEEITYENRVKGTDITTVDTRITDGDEQSQLSEWFTRHDDYFLSDSGNTNVDGYLTAKRYRVHEQFAQQYNNRAAGSVSAANIFRGKAFSLGSHAKTSNCLLYTSDAADE